MKIDEKETTSSSAPDDQYEKGTIIDDSELEVGDTSGGMESGQRTLKIRISEDVGIRCKFKIDIEREEEKRFFSRLNRELKRIK